MSIDAVDYVLVDLVREAIRIVRAAEIGDELEFVLRKDLARWIIRMAKYDRARSRVKGGRKLFLIKNKAVLGAIERYITRRCVCKDRIRPVILIERLEQDDLVARIDRGHHRRDHPFGRAARYSYLAFGIDIEPEIRHRLLCDRLAKFLYAPRYCVLIMIGKNGVDRRLLYLLRRLPIGKSLTQIHGAIFYGLAAYLANDGFCERCSFSGDALTCSIRLRHSSILTLGLDFESVYGA